ncbi:MAG: nucleotidyltransferase family protein [Mariprofundales bacterium]
MHALLLAGGLGTRLRPLTDSIPKCLVSIKSKPLLTYWLELLLPQGIEKVLINTHYLSDTVRAFVATSPWQDRITLVHEEHLLGTAGTILANKDFFQDQTFLVAHADNLTYFDVEEFISHHHHRSSGIEATIMTFNTDTPSSCGIIELDDRCIVQALHEKSPSPPGNLANAAIYIFEPTVINNMLAEMGGKQQFIDISTELLPRLLGKMWTFHNHHYLRDIGTKQSLEIACNEYPM